MARSNLIIEIVGDARRYIASLQHASAATTSFQGELGSLSVDVKATASAQVAAAVETTAALRKEIVAYQAIAASSEAGSATQIAASNLAARSQLRLSRSYGVTSHESQRLGLSAKGAERDIGHATRGALAGSGVFRAFGRSLAFASGGFLAFATGAQFIRTSVDAAETSRKAFRSLGAQAKAAGTTARQARADINALSTPGAKFGFNQADLEQGFTVLLRGSGSAKKALSEMTAAEEVARAKGMTLSQGALIVNRALISTGNSARALGIHFPKAATQAEKLAIILQRFRGQAAANTTEMDRFKATLYNSEVIIGNGLLPVLNRYLASASAWLTQMNKSGRLQRDVAKATHDLGVAVHVVTDAFATAKRIIHGVDLVTGSFANTVRDLAAAWVILKARMAINWATTALGIRVVGTAAAAATGEIAAVGTASAVAAGEAGALRLSLLSLGDPLVLAAIIAAATAFDLFTNKQPLTTRGRPRDSGGNTSIVQGKDGTFYTQTRTANRGSRGTNLKRITPNAADNALRGTMVPGVSGLPVDPFAPNRFGKGNLGIGNLTRGEHKDPHIFPGTAFRPRGTSLQGQFNLDELKLADAERANNTRLQRQILVSEEAITLKLRDQAKTLKDRTTLAQQAASIEDQIRGLDQSAVTDAAAAQRKAQEKRKKAADAAAKAALGGVPLRLQLAQAKADALAAGMDTASLTAGQLSAAKAIRAAEYKAINSHKLSMQGLIDAWNEIGTINQQLKNQGHQTETYRTVSSHALTAGMGLTRDQRVSEEERLSQFYGHGKQVPTGPAALGQPITINGGIHLHGVHNVPKLASDLEKHARHHPRRGQR